MKTEPSYRLEHVFRLWKENAYRGMKVGCARTFEHEVHQFAADALIAKVATHKRDQFSSGTVSLALMVTSDGRPAQNVVAFSKDVRLIFWQIVCQPRSDLVLGTRPDITRRFFVLDR